MQCNARMVPGSNDRNKAPVGPHTIDYIYSGGGVDTVVGHEGISLCYPS